MRRLGFGSSGHPNGAGCGDPSKMVNGAVSGGVPWSVQAMVHRRTNICRQRLSLNVGGSEDRNGSSESYQKLMKFLWNVEDCW
ncbi:hypothetical protein D8674_029791 [Pyrus ussuriensis x Pyrus communis]|uniref:Uncharacterized protein n=1 Tax=Pyrus ussuriensis x Pyrus communis TaxID=2448454 RepID=A0A5N5IDU5_9ROSA|nr:hypothetical protein D8674_029791 [Pyrus ussuriensis x Pyrus communis]